MTAKLCKCGEPIKGNYNGRCEDCWANAIGNSPGAVKLGTKDETTLRAMEDAGVTKPKKVGRRTNAQILADNVRSEYARQKAVVKSANSSQEKVTE